MADRRTRVLWLAKGLGQGGMERLLVTQAQLGDRRHFDYRAAYLVDRPHSVVAELEALGVPTTRLGRGNAVDPRWVTDLIRMVRRDRIDVLHVHSPLPAAVARPLVRALAPRTRIVYTEHNRWDRYTAPTRLANRATFGLNHRVFAVSDDCRASMAPRARHRVETLVHGIDVQAVAEHRGDRAAVRAELGIADDRIVVGTVANLRAQKNYPLLLEVAAKVVAQEPGVRFLAVGQGPLEDELNELHRRLGLGDRFRFLGFRADAPRVMSAFDVFCLSSDFEGLPVALMEARALGLPVVATSVGGVTGGVDDGVDGILVPPRDPAALFDALVAMAGDRGLRVRLARGSEARAGQFDAARALARLDRAYAETA